MPLISKDCSNTILERLFNYDAPCDWNKSSEPIRTLTFDCFKKSVKTMIFTHQYGCWLYITMYILLLFMMWSLLIIVSAFCYLVHWTCTSIYILDFKWILLLLLPSNTHLSKCQMNVTIKLTLNSGINPSNILHTLVYWKGWTFVEDFPFIRRSHNIIYRSCFVIMKSVQGFKKYIIHNKVW